MTEINYLAKELKETSLDWALDKSYSWMLSVRIESLVPSSLFQHRMKGYIKKACRLIFVSYVTERRVGSFNQLKPGELVRIQRWLDGNGPSPSDDKQQEDREVNEIVRIAELTEFWLAHRKEILILANNLKVLKRRKR